MFKKWRLMIALATALCVPVAAFADDLPLDGFADFFAQKLCKLSGEPGFVRARANSGGGRFAQN